MRCRPPLEDEEVIRTVRSIERTHARGNEGSPPTFKAMTRISAGLLLFRRRGGLEVLLAHPGGPYWQNKNEGAWTVPKGEIEAGEDEFAAARREFAEETGYLPQGGVLSLGSARQPGGKLVHVWALADDWDPAQLRSNTFSMEWPPKSGRSQVFPRSIGPAGLLSTRLAGKFSKVRWCFSTG